MNGPFGAIRRWIVRTAEHIYVHLKAWSAESRYEQLQRDGVVIVGRHSYGVPIVYTFRGNDCKLRVGRFVSITDGITILLGGNHPSDWVSTFPFRARLGLEGGYRDGMPFTKGDVVIGNDVWIGAQCMIMSGVTIGSGSIVAAGSVVTHDVPPYAIVAGAGAKIVRYRFSPEIIEELLRIQWWDWDDERIKSSVPLLSSRNVEEFVRFGAENR